MKRKISLFCILALLIMSLVGCGDDVTITEVEVITIRPYSTTKQSGLIAVKEEVKEYIEYTYEYKGKIYLDQIRTFDLEVGEKTVVIIEDYGNGTVFDNLQLSLEDYKKMYGMDDAEN